MKHTMLRSLSLFGLSLMMGLSVAAQDGVKVKTGDQEYKYKSEDLKIKEQKEESKYKSQDLKMKENENERKIKAKVKPVKPTSTEQTVVKTGETQVRAKEHVTPLTTETAAPAPVVMEEVAVPKTSANVKKTTPRKYAAKKTSQHKHTAARKPNTASKTVVRTKIIRDTVYVPSPPERIVSTQTEYVRDTVFVTRVDTVERMQTKNTYAGYRVPAGDFKKVKLKKDKDGEVWMKTKE